LGAGGLVFTPIAKGLITSYGVLDTFSIMGILFGLLVVGASFLLKNPPDGYKPAGWTPPAAGSVAAVVRNYPPSAMLTTPQFYALAVVLLIGTMSGLMVIPFGKILATQAGLSDTVATSAIMLISIGNASGRFIWGTVSDKLGRLRTIMVILCISGTTMLFLNQLTGIISLVGIGIVAFCYGGILGTMPATTADFFGAKNLGMNYGLLLLAFSTSAIGAPIVAGMAKDATGDFKTAFLIGGISCLLALAIAFFTKPPAARE
jgi:OFA family oxalate/formate antiporter-like MFS transporter